jgi:hypothetical protein
VLGNGNDDLESARAGGLLLNRMLGLMAAANTLDEAVRLAESRRAPQRVQTVLTKAAQAAATSDTIGVTLGSEMGVVYSQARNLGAADAIAPFAVTLSRYLNRFNLMTSVAPATVTEGSATPVMRLLLSSVDATPSKGQAMVVVTREVAMEADVIASVRRELMRSIVQWSDGKLFLVTTPSIAKAIAVQGLGAGINSHGPAARSLALGSCQATRSRAVK